jgi:hypothetical protein
MLPSVLLSSAFLPIKTVESSIYHDRMPELYGHGDGGKIPEEFLLRPRTPFPNFLGGSAEPGCELIDEEVSTLLAKHPGTCVIAFD